MKKPPKPMTPVSDTAFGGSALGHFDGSVLAAADGQQGTTEAPRRTPMPEKRTVERARQARREGKRPTTQAGEFVREEIEHVRRGKHGARSTKQAIAIGLSKARRAGVKLAPPPKGRATAKTRKSAETRMAA
jgi:hypothetical protein